MGKLGILEVLPVLKKFEAAYAYYELIAQKNKVKAGPFNKRVVEAYWIGNELLEKVKARDLREMIVEKFTRPGLLSIQQAETKVKLIPESAKPHHSFHVLILGSITGRVDFDNNTKLMDICRIGWGKVSKLKTSKISISYNPLIGKKIIKLGKPIKKEIIWDKKILPGVKVGDWVSFHWNYAIQVLREQDILNLYKYTQNTLDALLEKK